MMIEELYNIYKEKKINDRDFFNHFFVDLKKFNILKKEEIDLLSFDFEREKYYDNSKVFILKIFNFLSAKKDKKSLFYTIKINYSNEYYFIMSCSENKIFKKNHIPKIKKLLFLLKDFFNTINNLNKEIAQKKIIDFNNLDRDIFAQMSNSNLRSFLEFQFSFPLSKRIKIHYNQKKETISFYDNYNPHIIKQVEDFFLEDSLILEFPLFPNSSNFVLFKQDFKKDLAKLKNIK